jgi:hypothetical protein
MTKFLATIAAAALLTSTAAMAQMGSSAPSKPGDPTSVKEGQANCPAGTTANNCQKGDANPSSTGRSSSQSPNTGSGDAGPGGPGAGSNGSGGATGGGGGGSN